MKHILVLFLISISLIVPQRTTHRGNRSVVSGDVTDYKVRLVAGIEAYTDAGTTLATDTQTVQQWEDQSGNAHHAIQTSGANKPIYRTGVVNGKSVIDFIDPAFLTIADHADIEMNLDSTVFVVTKVNDLSVGRTFLAKDDGSNPAAYFYATEVTTGKPNLDRPFVEAGVPATNGVGTTNFNVIVCKVSGTTVSHFLNGVANGTDTLATGTANNIVLSIGSTNVGTQRLNGDIAEIRIYNRALTSLEVESVETVLGAEYAITISWYIPLFYKKEDYVIV